MNLEAELDGLYRSPLGEFVERRNELAKSLRGSGDRAAADRVKALAKPTLTAWAVNQLAFRAAAELGGLLAAGARVRAAHLSSPAEQRAAAEKRRAVISALLAVAEFLLAEAGHAMSRAHRQRIARTLEVLSSRAPEGDEPGAGRLSQDLEPAGFDALTDLAAALEQAQKRGPRAVEPEPEPEPEPTAPTPDPRPEVAGPVAVEDRREEEERRAAARRARERQLEEARRVVGRLEEKMADLRLGAERAGRELAQAKRAAEELAAAAVEAERQAKEAGGRAEAARAAAGRARLEADSAAAALRRAESQLEEARLEVDR